MKFIFPRNYNISNKFLGVFDYPTVIFNISLNIFCYFFLKLFIKKISNLLFFQIILTFPFLLFSFTGFNHENIIYVMFYIFNYLFSTKLYLYKKD